MKITRRLFVESPMAKIYESVTESNIEEKIDFYATILIELVKIQEKYGTHDQQKFLNMLQEKHKIEYLEDETISTLKTMGNPSGRKFINTRIKL